MKRWGFAHKQVYPLWHLLKPDDPANEHEHEALCGVLLAKTGFHACTVRESNQPPIMGKGVRGCKECYRAWREQNPKPANQVEPPRQETLF